MDSMPPATAISVSPCAMDCAARPTARRPEPQTMLIVSALTVSGMPPRNAAWRAGFCPRPAGSTQPIMHSSTLAESIPARSTAARTAIAPSSTALNDERPPRNFPTGVRTALTITTSRMDESPDNDSAYKRLATTKYTSLLDAFASMQTHIARCRRRVYNFERDQNVIRMSSVGCAKQVRNSPLIFFFLLTLRRRKSIPSLAALQRRWSTSIGSAGKRNQGKATNKGNTLGGRQRERPPRCFLPSVHAGFRVLSKFFASQYP